MSHSLRILMIVQNIADIEAAVSILSQANFDTEWTQVVTETDLREALRAPWDLVLLEVADKTRSTQRALATVQTVAPLLPVILYVRDADEHSIVPLLVSGANDFVENSDALRLVSVVRRELRVGQQNRQQSLLSSLVETSRDAIFAEDMRGNITVWNSSAEQLLGWNSSEVLGKPLELHVSPHPVISFVDLKKEVLADGVARNFETVLRSQQGRYVDVMIKVSPLLQPGGERIGLAAFIQDLSAQREKEAEHYRSESLLRALIEGIPDAAFVKDLSGRYLLFNHAASQFVGLPPSEVIGKTDFEIFNAEDADTVRRTDHEVLESGEVRTREEVLTGADGTRVYQATKAPLKDAFGRTIGLLGISRDITENRRVQAEFETHQAKLAEAVQIARLGYWNRDPESHRLEWSEQLYEIFDVTPDEFDHTFEGFLSLIHEDDRAHVRKIVEQSIKRGGEFDHVYRVPVATGVRVIHEVGRIELTESGEIQSIAGTAQDITQEWLSEETLRKSEERFRAFMDNSPAPGWLTDLEGRMLYVSESYKRIFDLPTRNPEGQYLSELFPAEVARSYRENNRRVAETGEVLEVIEFARGIDGTVRECQVYKFPVPTVDGQVHIGGIAIDITDRKRAESELRLRDRAIQSLRQGLLITDPHRPDNPIIYANPGFEALTGYSMEECLDRNCRFLQGPETDPAVVAQIRNAVRQGESLTVELLNYRKDGSTFWNELSISPVRDDNGKITHFVGGQVDVTQRRQLEDQFRQAQKMEAVGQLAGGIAHDFNNLLTIINGYSDFVLEDLPPDHPSREDLNTIRSAGERSAALTQQLLAYGRRQVLNPRRLNLNEVVTDTGSMLRRIIGEDITLEIVPSAEGWTVQADRNQLEQVILNLAVNARDAMPAGGHLQIEIHNRDFANGDDSESPDMERRKYVCITVRDTGTGMSRDVQTKIFEPFYTTKEIGKGTGLGLSVVHGIVRQSDGFITVESQPQEGTIIEVCLPAVDGEALDPQPDHASREFPQGQETILLVEDEPGLRSLTRRMLESQGYIVLEAFSAEDALRIVGTGESRIDLLLTDIVMPQMNGREVATEVRRRMPEIRVLLMSGYTDDKSVRDGNGENTDAFLAKPFTKTMLLRKIRQVMNPI